jgi:hypothetical protein
MCKHQADAKLVKTATSIANSTMSDIPSTDLPAISTPNSSHGFAC